MQHNKKKKRSRAAQRPARRGEEEARSRRVGVDHGAGKKEKRLRSFRVDAAEKKPPIKRKRRFTPTPPVQEEKKPRRAQFDAHTQRRWLDGAQKERKGRQGASSSLHRKAERAARRA